MATKLLMMATLQVNSQRFAETVNLRVVNSHLRYYAFLCLSRAVCLTIPELGWAHGGLLKMSHERAIKHAVDHVAQFDRSVAGSVNFTTWMTKAQRELVDYRAPSSGDTDLNKAVVSYRTAAC